MPSDPLEGRVLASTTVASLEMAAGAAVADQRPIGTFDLLVATIGQDLIGEWDRLQLATTFVARDGSERVPDPDERPTGTWRNVPLTASAHDALGIAARLADGYQMTPLPPGLLALGIVWDSSWGAARALLDGSEASHAALLGLVQDEILGTELEGVDRVIDRVHTAAGVALRPALAAAPTYDELTDLARTMRPAANDTTGAEDGDGPVLARDGEPPPELARRLGVASDDVEILRRPTSDDQPWVAAGPDRVVKIYDLHGLTEARERALRAQPAIAAALDPKAALVPVLSVTDDAGWLTIELPRMRRSIRGHLEAAARGDEPRWSAARYADELARVGAALQAMHDRGLIHEDVKPDNLLEDEAGYLALADYAAMLGGSLSPDHAPSESRLIRRPTRIGRRQNPRREKYLAPERYLGETGPAVDQYALGVVALETFAGPGAPPTTAPVHDVLTRATAPDPEARFPSVAAFGDALQDAVRREAPRGLAERLAALPAHRRAAIGPGLVAAAAGLLAAVREAHTVPNAAALEPLTGLFLIIMFVIATVLPIIGAGALRRKLRRSDPKGDARARLAACLFVGGVGLSLALRDNPGPEAAVLGPLGVVYGTRALLLPPARNAAGFLIRAAKAWDRIASRPRLRRSLATAVFMAVVASFLSPLVVAHRWPAPPSTSPASDFGSLAAVWNFRAFAGSGQAVDICRSGIAFPKTRGGASCVDVVTVAGGIERVDPVSHGRGPVFGSPGTFDRFRVSEVSAPTGIRLWQLHPAGSRLVAGAFYTIRDTHPHVYVMISRLPPRPENKPSLSIWAYDVEVLQGSWKVTSATACTLVGRGGGLQPAACVLRNDSPKRFVQQLLDAMAKAKKKAAG